MLGNFKSNHNTLCWVTTQYTLIGKSLNLVVRLTQPTTTTTAIPTNIFQKTFKVSGIDILTIGILS